MSSISNTNGVSKYRCHPLDPLSPKELESAVSIVKEAKSPSAKARFVEVDLWEPTRSAVTAFEDGGPRPEREVTVVVVEADGAIYKGIISLSKCDVISWGKLEGPGQPAILPSEFFEIQAAVKASPLFAEALASRGIKDIDNVVVDPWSVGHYGLEYESKGQRLAMAMCFLRAYPGDNAYARPLDGLTPIIDLTTMTVIHVDNFVGPHTAVPPKSGNYTVDTLSKECKSGDPFNKGLKPLLISQPEGPTFEVHGNLVRWMHWQVRVGWTAREGLVLHQLSFQDKGKRRPVVYRAAVNEMVVPYGDPRPQHFRKNAFDVGDYGMGRCANSLKKGCDCLGEIYYFDAYMTETTGEVYKTENAICMHEEDYGTLWKHTDWVDGHAEVRRSRRLVISTFTTVANYEYGFFWYLYLDGTIQMETKLTGVINVGTCGDGEVPKYGTIIAPNLYGPIHEHMLNYRIHMAVDDGPNEIHEVNIEAEPPGPNNPQKNAFYVKETTLKTELEAQRVVNPQSGRYWKVVNKHVTNPINGASVAYKLLPGENILPFASPDASFMKRGAFAHKHLFVTPYRRDERFAAGEFPNQNPGGEVADGLPRWTKQDRNLVDEDLVLWYTMGVLHVPRPEDWPVMPCAYAGFHLKPQSFFEQNPAINLAPPSSVAVNGTNGTNGHSCCQ